MCLIALALGMHPDFPLVIAANRDEFFDRPTAPLSEWRSDAGTAIVGGRDLRGGGAAMALTRNGRIAMLTNVRDPLDTRSYTRSRGELVLSWLESDLPFEAWLGQTQAVDFAGFNLILGDYHAQAWHWVSNRCVSPAHAVSPAMPWRTQGLASGQIVTLSNASLSTPWPKSMRLAGSMQAAIDAHPKGAAPDQDAISSGLWSALQNTQIPADADLPRTAVDPALEKALASCFVDLRQQPKAYGTRSSSLIFGKRTGKGLEITVSERSWPLLPSHTQTSMHSFVQADYSLGW
jgi:uncharacterized protein with NRDE domain